METLLQYKCPCCGGKIEFNSGTQKMKCPFCDTEFDVEALKGYDDVLKTEKPDDMSALKNESDEWNEAEADGLSVYVCKSCGGEIVADKTTAATACPFCGNPVVISGKLAGDLKPDYVIPFKLDKKAAKAALTNHFKGKKLLPKLFSDQNHIDEIKGVYVPFWLYDADADANIRYRATRSRSWSDSNYNYTETSYYSVQRSGSLSFAHVPVDGSTKMPDDLMESIEPYNSADAVDFQTAYLSGYLADRYDVTSDDSRTRANQRIKKCTEDTFASTVKGYTTLVPENSNVQINSGSIKYALYPVWILNTNWNGKKYLFAMNAQTGKFVGDLPMDKGAFFRWLFGLTAVCGAVTLLLLMLLNMM